eukprot:scaffold3103_cov132-Skeletonema_menzelii.AAC.3
MLKSREDRTSLPIMPSKPTMNSDRQKSSKPIGQYAQKSALKKLRRSGSIKLDLSLLIERKPKKILYESLKCESSIGGASVEVENTSSSETEGSKKSQDEMDIHRGFYV